jgi:hypothetical protein
VPVLCLWCNESSKGDTTEAFIAAHATCPTPPAEKGLPVLVYVTTAWGEVYASLEAAKQACDEYLSKCYNHGEPHVEDGTDEAGWFQFGEPPSLREWRRFFTDRDHSNPLHFPAQSIRERVLRGAETGPLLPPVVAYRWTRSSDGEVFVIDPREVEIVRVLPPGG